MRRRKYSEEYHSSRRHSPSNLNPLEQIARTAIELQKLLGSDYFEAVRSSDDYYKSSSSNNNNRSNSHYDDADTKYYSLCVSKLPHRMSDYDIRDVIYRECDCFNSDFNVKISNYNGQRVAYINFRSSRDAAKARNYLRDFRIESKSVFIEPVIQKKRNSSPSNTRSRSPKQYYNDNSDNFNRKNYYKSEGDSNIGYSSSNNNNSKYSRYRSPSNSPAPKQRRYDNNNNNRNNNNISNNHNNRDPGLMPTRTLFVGNLPFDVTESEIRKLFGKYGNLTDIDIKKSTTNRLNSYAFIKFENLDIATQAKKEISGKVLRKYQLKIGFGKVNPTNCVWVGGLGPWIPFDSFEKEMSRFGPIKQINWPHNKSYAYVLYDSVDIAITAVNNLRGTCFGEEKKSIKVDYADSSCMNIISDSSHNTSGSSNTGRSIRDKKSMTSSNSSCYNDDSNISLKSAKSISQLVNCLDDVWTGMITLKNNNFGCRLYMLKGEKSLVDEYIFGNTSSTCNEISNLTITQRMKLDPNKLSEMTTRIESAGEHGFCLLLACSYLIDEKLLTNDATNNPQPQRPLKNLITYLRTKESAGVIFLKSSHTEDEEDSNSVNSAATSGVLHAFPPCEFSFDILCERANNLTKDFTKDDFLVILLIRNNS